MLLLLLLLVGGLLAVAQPVVPPPPPPVKKEPEKPKTPERIRVGCHPSSAYLGPAGHWASHNNGGASLSDAQIARLEAALAATPDDVCARGYLIAHGGGYVRNRIKHVLWMIEHRPEWDGFLVAANHPIEADERELAEGAWHKQTGPGQLRAEVFHNAAVFFEWRAPETAEALYQHAMQLASDPGLHLERLGALYGEALRSESRNPPFFARAQRAVFASDDWRLLAGALSRLEMSRYDGPEISRQLRTRLREMIGEGKPVPPLPSRAARYRQRTCESVRLERICVDQR